MNISGDYGTELLLRYTEERLARELEDQRVANERAAEDRRENGTRLSRFARFFFHQEVAAGGPEWVRPAVHAEPATDRAVRPDVGPTAGQASEPEPETEPETAVVSDVPTAPNDERMPSPTLDERMPSRTLVGTRR